MCNASKINQSIHEFGGVDAIYFIGPVDQISGYSSSIRLLLPLCHHFIGESSPKITCQICSIPYLPNSFSFLIRNKIYVPKLCSLISIIKPNILPESYPSTISNFPLITKTHHLNCSHHSFPEGTWMSI
jgi:hypothetical protein